MQVHTLDIADTLVFEPDVFPDERGVFGCPYQEKDFVAALGYALPLAQSNHSVSARGALRGVHFAEVPPGQAKYVYCARGSGVDIVVDLRVGSPTFGRHETVRLDDKSMRAVFVGEGLGHGFFACEDDTVLTYLCSTAYNPAREHGIDPFDADLALPWPDDITPLLSPKDASAPSLAQLRERGLLPDYAACRQWYAQLRD